MKSAILINFYYITHLQGNYFTKRQCDIYIDCILYTQK